MEEQKQLDYIFFKGIELVPNSWRVVASTSGTSDRYMIAAEFTQQQLLQQQGGGGGGEGEGG